MSENNGLNEFMFAIGALAEMMRMYRDELLKNGFSRREAIQLTQAFMLEQIKQNRKEDN